jgi:protein-tyrosine phosphatase
MLTYTYTMKTNPKILFVCLGNICRSPTAHAIAQKIRPDWEFESAGTCAEVGNTIDPRAQNELRKNNILFSHIARQLTKNDIGYYDYIFVSDGARLRDVQKLASHDQRSKIKLLANMNIPDPYYDCNFNEVFAIIKRSVENRIQEIERN